MWDGRGVRTLTGISNLEGGNFAIVNYPQTLTTVAHQFIEVIFVMKIKI